MSCATRRSRSITVNDNVSTAQRVLHEVTQVLCGCSGSQRQLRVASTVKNTFCERGVYRPIDESLIHLIRHYAARPLTFEDMLKPAARR